MSATPAITPLEYRAALRSDFYAFAVRCFLELNAAAPFQPAPHVEIMAARLQAVRDGRAKRLVVALPPRHLKSLAASIALPAWLLGHDPHAAIVNVGLGILELCRRMAEEAEG